jgi:hypothetical protein
MSTACRGQQLMGAELPRQDSEDDSLTATVARTPQLCVAINMSTIPLVVS